MNPQCYASSLCSICSVFNDYDPFSFLLTPCYLITWGVEAALDIHVLISDSFYHRLTSNVYEISIHAQFICIFFAFLYNICYLLYGIVCVVREKEPP
ncbi:hypothetical protein VNO80_18497 [Phaseolus coccineus]|uniref:Uncharacterized protein n=1 Tax=Phaseolus coccineus TaxID=3886 RepID=A0AAN9MKJ2_PHACN